MDTEKKTISCCCCCYYYDFLTLSSISWLSAITTQFNSVLLGLCACIELLERTKCAFDLLISDLIRLIVETPHSIVRTYNRDKQTTFPNRNHYIHLIRCNFYVIKSFESAEHDINHFNWVQNAISLPYQRIDFKSFNEIGM